MRQQFDTNFPITRRDSLIGIAGLLSTLEAAHANKAWRLLINEAVSGDNNLFILTNKYRPIADLIGQAIKIKQIDVEPIIDIPRFFSIASAANKPQLVFGKSVNQLAKLVRDHGYQPVARRADPYKSAFIVGKDSPIKNLKELGQATVIMPDESAATTAVGKAELARQQVKPNKLLHVRYQDAVLMSLKSGMGQVGLVNPSTAKKWVAEGGRVIAETQPVVNWSMLAAPQVEASIVEQLTSTLLAMNTQATSLMESLGFKEWAKAEKQDYLQLLAYTKE